MDKALVSTSKFLSLVLRHRPETIGIKLDESGWVAIADLLKATNSHPNGKRLDRELLVRAVRENDKQRFAISEDGLRIRANQGHSVNVDLGLEPVKPPAILYHGTVDKFIDSIRTQGLLPRKRQFVHLSPDTETANIVGKRRGKPVILSIDSKRMDADAIKFYRSQNGVWLVDHVPPQYISFPTG